MSWTGKTIGMILGFMLGGPIGLLIGLFLGHMVDQGLLQRWFNSASFTKAHQARVQKVFFDTTFLIMGYVAKSDGHVSENEIRAARKIMNQMNLTEPMRREAIRLFNDGKAANFNWQSSMTQLKQACFFQPNLLRMFLEIQIQMAHADGQILSQRKRQVLQGICNQLGVAGFNFSQFEQRFRGEQNYQRSYQRPQTDPRQFLDDAYKVLGVSKDASDAEVKKAYRRLMSQHHPDKLMSKGLPPEMIKMATEKTQRIKSAYEQICKARAA